MELVSSSAVIRAVMLLGQQRFQRHLVPMDCMCSNGASDANPCSLDAVVSALEASASTQQAIYAKYTLQLSRRQERFARQSRQL